MVRKKKENFIKMSNNIQKNQLAYRVGTEFIAGIFVGVLFGYIFDYYFQTKPWGIIIFILLLY